MNTWPFHPGWWEAANMKGWGPLTQVPGLPNHQFSLAAPPITPHPPSMLCFLIRHLSRWDYQATAPWAWPSLEGKTEELQLAGRAGSPESHEGGDKKRGTLYQVVETHEPGPQLKSRHHSQGCPHPHSTPGTVSLWTLPDGSRGRAPLGTEIQPKRQSQQGQLLLTAPGSPWPWSLVSSGSISYYLPSKRPPHKAMADTNQPLLHTTAMGPSPPPPAKLPRLGGRVLAVISTSLRSPGLSNEPQLLVPHLLGHHTNDSKYNRA